MGKYSYELLKYVVGDDVLKNYKNIVETGSLFGDGTELMSIHFENVYTIEIQPFLYEIVKRRFSHKPNIYCYNGDSVEVLQKIVPEIHGPTVFFLDAHWSGDNSVDWENSGWKGYNINTGYRGTNTTNPENQNPLFDEINLLVKILPNEFILYIDDTEKFDSNGNGLKNRCFVGEDWTHLSIPKIESLLANRLLKKYSSGDQIIYYIAASNC